MFNHLKKAKSKGNSGKPKRKHNNHQARKDDQSKFVTCKRLSKPAGLFGRGQISSSVLRDPVLKEEIRARAEDDLSRILHLARAGLSNVDSLEKAQVVKDTDCQLGLSCHSVPSTKPFQNKYLGQHRMSKHQCHHDVPATKDQDKSGTHKKGSPYTSPYISLEGTMVHSFSSMKDAMVESQKIGNSCLKQATKNATPSKEGVKPSPSKLCEADMIDIPYADFEVIIKKSLNEANAILKTKTGSNMLFKLKDLVQCTLRQRHFLLTPPSCAKGISYFMEKGDCEKNKICRGKSLKGAKELDSIFASSSSSAITPNFNATFCSPCTPLTPQKMIRRYERKLANYRSLDNGKTQSKKEQILSGTEISKESSQVVQENLLQHANKSSATPTHLRSNGNSIPKTVLIDPFDYLQQYEKTIGTENIDSNKENLLPLRDLSHHGAYCDPPNPPILANNVPLPDFSGPPILPTNKPLPDFLHHNIYTDPPILTTNQSDLHNMNFERVPPLHPNSHYMINGFSNVFPIPQQTNPTAEYPLEYSSHFTPNLQQYQQYRQYHPSSSNISNTLYNTGNPHNGNYLRYSELMSNRVASPALFSPLVPSVRLKPQSQNNFSYQHPLHQNHMGFNNFANPPESRYRLARNCENKSSYSYQTTTNSVPAWTQFRNEHLPPRSTQYLFSKDESNRSADYFNRSRLQSGLYPSSDEGLGSYASKTYDNRQPSRMGNYGQNIPPSVPLFEGVLDFSEQFDRTVL